MIRLGELYKMNKFNDNVNGEKAKKIANKSAAKIKNVYNSGIKGKVIIILGGLCILLVLGLFFLSSDTDKSKSSKTISSEQKVESGKTSFRETTWEMTPEQVKKIEGNDFKQTTVTKKDRPQIDDYNGTVLSLEYKRKLFDHEFTVNYYFNKNKLYMARYLLGAKGGTLAALQKKVAASLIKRYGKAVAVKDKVTGVGFFKAYYLESKDTDTLLEFVPITHQYGDSVQIVYLYLNYEKLKRDQSDQMKRDNQSQKQL